MEDKGWKIERTDFPFIKVEPKPNPSNRFSFQCVGSSVLDFLRFLYLDNPYSFQPGYDGSFQNAEGRAEYIFYYHNGTVDYDPLNLVKKPNYLNEDLAYLVVIRDIPSLKDNYLTTFPRIFKTTPTLTRQLVIVNVKNDIGFEQVTEEQLKTAAKFIGATHIIIIDRKKTSMREETINKICEEIVAQVPAKTSYTDENISKRFYMLALVSCGTLKQVQKQSDLLDPTFVDPLGNNLLHYTVLHKNQEMFYYIADSFPELINKQNLDNFSPIHSFTKERFSDIDWDRFWQLPIKFSRKNNIGASCLTQMQSNRFSFKAFEALIRNEAAWTKARKYHKRKVLLTNVVHKMLADWERSDMDLPSELPSKVEFIIKNGASIHHHDTKSLLNSAIKHKHRQTAIKLLELGAKLREEDLVACWNTGKEEMIRLVVNRPEMKLLSQDNLNYIAKCTVGNGLIDILRLLVKKGCKVDLDSNQKGKIVTGNLIAQMHCNSIIIPLKFQCVDVIYESIAQKNKERNKIFMHTGDEAQINWRRELKGYPEEIADLFPRKELWRWALFLQDERRQSVILKLYHAINRRVSDEKHTIKLTYGAVTFCFSRNGPEQQIWLGDFNSKSPKHRMYYKELSETTGGGHIEWYYEKEEYYEEVLVEIMTACGWDPEDKYVFLHILHTALFPNPDNVHSQWCFFTSYIYEFLKPPQWYADFVKQIYGLVHPDRPMNSYSRY